ncbi:hypothetical protein B296_00044300 [Ensete ventricosum]|uniref:Uncharacterized protein n=1 Tax=Ensete ventricosum TaxID=4639 RepID=A0A426XEP6_ENSVE|nr:hypothetical protein B296_00044300 [Ensete ventricosum]
MADVKPFTSKLFVDKARKRGAFVESDKDFVDVLLSFLTLPIGTISFAEQQTSSLPWVEWLSSTGGLSASPQQAVLEGRGEQADAASSEEFICN